MVSRKAAIEALTGAPAGRVLSCEIFVLGVPTSFNKAEGNIEGSDTASSPRTPRSLRNVQFRWINLIVGEGDTNPKTSRDVSATILGLLQEGYEKGVTVDLKGAEHIDSMGVSILMEAFEVAQKRNMDFILTGLNGSPRRVQRALNPAESRQISNDRFTS
jgi:anti-anti-sigma regulatory factor